MTEMVTEPERDATFTRLFTHPENKVGRVLIP